MQKIEISEDSSAEIEKLQIMITTSDPLDGYMVDGTTTITGENMVVTKTEATYITELQGQADFLAYEIADAPRKLQELVDKKAKIDAQLVEANAKLADIAVKTGKPYTPPTPQEIPNIETKVVK